MLDFVAMAKNQPVEKMSLLSFMGSAGIAGLFLGIGGTLLAGRFTWLMWSTYAGALLLLLQLLLGKGLTVGARLLGGIAVISFAVWFSVEVTFHKDPITVRATSQPNVILDSDGKVDGIKWQQEYYYNTQIAILNDSDNDYTDMDIDLAPDRNIAAIVQTTKHDGVEILPEGFAMGVPFEVMSSNSKSIHVDKLRKHDMLMFTLAIVTLDKKNPMSFLPKSRPNWVRAHIHYLAPYSRYRTIDDTFTIQDIP